MTRMTAAAPVALAQEWQGNHSFLLDDPARIIRVTSGAVELFLVEIAEGVPAGVRHHVMSITAGGLLFGADGAQALSPVGLLAVPLAGTRLVEFQRDAILSPEAVDGWIAGLYRAMLRPIQPPVHPDVLLTEGEGAAVGPGGRFGSRERVLWIATDTPDALLFDTEAVEGLNTGCRLPLAHGAWIGLPHGGTADAVDTAMALAGGWVEKGLAALHSAALDALVLNLRLLAVDEVNRLRNRAQADLAAAGSALDGLGALFDRSGEHRDAGPLSGDALIKAAAVLAQALGSTFQVPEPIRSPEGLIRPARFDDVLAVNQWRAREIRLDDGWWRRDIGPVLLFDAADGRPLVVLSGRRGDTRIVVDPVAGRRTVRPCAGLRGAAFSIHIPLPGRPLRGLDIGGNALRWSRGDVAGLIGLGLASSLLGAAVPIATGYLIDTVIPDHDRSGLVEMGAVLLVLAVMILGLNTAAQVAALRIEGRAGSRLQEAVLDRLLRLPVGFFKNHTAGDLAKRALAIQAIEQAVGSSLIGTLMSSVASLIALGLMVWYAWQLALLAFGMILLVASIGLVLGMMRIRRDRAVIATDGKLAGLLLQLSCGIAKLRQAAAENRAFLRWARLYSFLGRQRFAAHQIDTVSELVGSAALPLATAGLFAAILFLELGKGAFGAGGPADGGTGGGLALGMLIAFLSAFGQAMGGVSGLVGALVQIAALQPLYAYAAPILDAVPETTVRAADPGVLSGAIQVDRLRFRYAPHLPLVFDNLSLSVEAGEFVAVVGLSGSGKSTLLRLLLGFEAPETGAILYDGQDLHGLNVQAVRCQMGVVLQAGRLTPGTLLEYIQGGNPALSEADAWEAVEQVGLADDLRGMPMGLRTIVTDSGGTLSGGQVQRLLLARTIAAKPRILLLDEATSALDNRTQATVARNLDQLSATRIVVAHRLSTVVNADRIVVVRNGVVEESGSYEALTGSNGVFRALVSRQLL